MRCGAIPKLLRSRPRFPRRRPPLEGWRHVEVTGRQTAVDYAQVLKDISDSHFPKAKKIVLVQDNLNIHKPASLYEAFPAVEARRLVALCRVSVPLSRTGRL
jgi:hypothetical protein